MSEQISIFAQIKPRPSYFDAARNAICDIIDRTRAEPGCIEFRLNENADDGTLYLYEEWRDKAALASHYEQPYTRAVFEAYETWLAEEPRIQQLRPVG